MIRSNEVSLSKISGLFLLAFAVSTALGQDRKMGQNYVVETAGLNAALTVAKAKGSQVVFLGTEIQTFSGEFFFSKLNESGSNQIIIVDGGEQKPDLMLNLLAKGNVIISLGNAKVDKVKSAMGMLTDVASTGKFTKALDDYDNNQTSAYVSTWIDGKEHEKVTVETPVNAFYFSPIGAYYFSSGRASIQEGLVESISWAADVVASNRPPLSKAYTLGTWELKQTRINTCEAKNPWDTTKVSGTNTFSYGLNQLQENNSSYNYLGIQTTSSMYPNRSRDNRNKSNRTSVFAANPVSTIDIHDYQPRQTAASSTNTYTLGVNSTGASGTMAGGYTITNVLISDYTKLDQEIADWKHTISRISSDEAKNTLTFEPDVIFRAANSVVNPWTGISYVNVAEFQSYNYAGLLYRTSSCSIGWNGS